jgi:hypothetical protein
VGEDSTAGLYVLLGKCRHQLADGRAKYLPHFAAWHGQVNDSGRLGRCLKDRIPAAWAALFNLFDGRECVLKDVLKVG